MRSAVSWAASSPLVALVLAVACSSGDGGSGGAAGSGAFGAAGAGGLGAGTSVGAGGTGEGGLGTGGVPAGGSGGEGGALPPADFRETGPYGVDVTTSSFTTTSSCVLVYDLYTPQGGSWSGLVVASHGLQCGRQHLANFAQHWASWGLPVVAPDLCHSTLVDLNQFLNGLDVIDLAHALGSGSVIYAGHSAGGLASLVAAAHDADALASFGLDPAEWSGIGAAAAPAITSPAYAALGTPSVCNGSNNALPIYASIAQGRVLGVTEADHCDFSSPNTCTQCQLGCGTGTNLLFSDAEITATIRGLSTAFLMEQAGLDASGAGWWTPGQPAYESLLAAGAIGEL